jgi:crossover junction endodeoxyribonuclease RuvC
MVPRWGRLRQYSAGIRFRGESLREVKSRPAKQEGPGSKMVTSGLPVLRYTGWRMRVFGIDCGTEVTGFGVVESCDGAREPGLTVKAVGAIRLAKARPLPERLKQIYCELTEEMKRWRPDTVAIEEVFYSVNAKSALKLGQVRGVALLAAAQSGVPVAEYAPLKIKSSVVGYGLAQKEQVQFMVARLLGMSEVPQPADAADALAVAICHIHTAQTRALQEVK